MVTTEIQGAGGESSCVSGSVGTGSLEVVGFVSSGTEGDVTGGSLVAGWDGSVCGGVLGSDVDGSVEELSFEIVFCSETPQTLQVRLDRPSFSAVGALTVVHAP